MRQISRYYFNTYVLLVLAAGALLALGSPGAAQSDPSVEVLVHTWDLDVGVPEIRRGYTEVGKVTVRVSADDRYDIKVWPSLLLGWGHVEVNPRHCAMAGRRANGFDLAITDADGTISLGHGRGAWAVGEAKLTNLDPATRTNEYTVHVRLVLVDREGETAGYCPNGDRVRYKSLPPGTYPVRLVIQVSKAL